MKGLLIRLKTNLDNGSDLELESEEKKIGEPQPRPRTLNDTFIHLGRLNHPILICRP